MLLSRLFPKVDFEAEFFCSNELASKLEYLERFCSALVPRERILSFFSTRRLGHVEIAALAGAIEAAQIDPFESSDPHIRIALLAGMISEVELISDHTRAKAGFQAIPWPLIAAQGASLSAMEEMYYPITDGACIPAWIHDGKEFTPGLSLPFLSEVVFHIANSEEAFVTIGGYKKVRSDILESLADVDDKVLLTAIFAIDAAGALTESLISSLGLDAEVLGARNLAALSPRVRGIIVSRAIGL
ncbi:hypothetical protein [Pseudomonas putida]|uniref:Uncharacterized protein n=1 Tax=Pseudomonas putida TaxID=303 RepID=A0A8I1JIC4_PSEPU|nr:hypothetical protein [Pseudomonas putida]MBI6882833.1 hypothetical protein [Pseudomonas putida]